MARLSKRSILREGIFSSLSVFLLLVSLLAEPCRATKHSFQINEDARSFIAPIGSPYGFLKNGVYNLTVYNFRLTTTGAAGKKSDEESVEGFEAGFLLKRFETESDFARFQDDVLQDSSNCSLDPLRLQLTDDTRLVGDVVDSGAKGILLSMRNVTSTWGPQNTPNVSHVFTANEEGFYFLVYQVCTTFDTQDINNMKKKKKLPFKEVRSTFQLDLDYTNIDSFGKISYLTAGEMVLPHLFLYFSVSYVLLLGIWVFNLRTVSSSSSSSGASGFGNRNATGKPVVYAIHHMMTILLTLKTISIFLESIRYHYIRIYGHAELWSLVYYTFAFLKGIFLFTVILLIGSGWSFVKPFLNDRERKVICLVLVLQVINNICIAILSFETKGERLYDNWSAILHLVDILCCCAVMLPIVWQVNSLEQNVESESASAATGSEEEGAVAGSNDNRSARTLSKLKLFRSFYLLVVTYIYFTRIVVYLFATSLGYRHTWVQHLITELGTLVFYTVTGIQFRPMVENPYLEVKREDYDDDEPTTSRRAEDYDMTRGGSSLVEMGSIVSGSIKEQH